MYRVFLLTTCLMPHGGLEERLVTIASALKTRGHQVVVFSRSAVAADNQYLLRLQEQQITLVSPAPAVAALAADWDTKVRAMEMFVRLGSPALAVAAAVGAPIQKRPFAAAWDGAKGRARNGLGRVFLPDYLDTILEGMLDFHYRFRGAPDVVHIHSYRIDMWQAVRWARRRRLATVFEEHSSPSAEFAPKPEAFSSPYQPNILIAVSEAARNELRNRFGSGIEVVVVPPIVEVGDLGANSALSSRRSGHQVTVTCLTRLSREKGIEDLLEAARRLAQTHPQVHFLIFGEGPLREALSAQIVDLGLSEIVSLCGSYSHSELPAIMARTDVLVLPSLTEALGLVIIEGMAYSRPIVATNVGGIPELVSDGATGLLVPPRDPSRLESALASLVDDADLRARLGDAARRAYIEFGFTSEAVIPQVLAAYDRAITSNHSKIRDTHRPELTPGDGRQDARR